MASRSQYLAGTNAFLSDAGHCLVFRFFAFSSNFTWTARTSGVLLIAGFGSYCAYRIANRILGNGFVYTLFDAAHCDLLARADVRLLHPEPPCSMRSAISVDNFEELPERTDRKPSRARSLTRLDDNGRKYIQVIEHPSLSRALASPTQKAGLAALPPIRNSNSRDRSRSRASECFDDASSVADSSVSEASRIRSGRRRPHFLRADQEPEGFDVDDDDDAMSIAPTETSEIRLMWDGDACWDDEFGDGMGVSNGCRQRAMSLTPSDISELSAFKTLQDMFNAPSTSTAPMPPPSESVFGDASDLAQLIHEKCTSNPNYMYHSVIVASSDADGTSDVVSVCSGRSNRSGQSSYSIFREKHKAASRRSQGLWELTASREREKSRLTRPSASQMCFLEPVSTGGSSSNTSPNIMTDSGISKSSFNTSSSRRDRGRSGSSSYTGPMMDSAIDTGFQSSDDESIAASASTSVKPGNTGIVRRSIHLAGIKESPSPAHSRRPRSSIAPSERSLEWFDD
uniref:Protein kinase domain-containing protein n=1 Tax=Panagrellus redivivus TaxID=6233 RepID=A0A7E4VSA5_PANRE